MKRLTSLRRPTHLLPLAAIGAVLAVGAGAAAAHDYPTADRVVYVQECMKLNPGHHYEMLNKCSCVLDKLASQISFDDFTTMSTATNANSMGGERGNSIRDVEVMQVEIKRFRELQAAARKSCFFDVGIKE
ncbi:hypothetical protein C1M51_06825 [Methylibium sp. Pch-M]|uniref:hypothetical protein n=1 Tax=Methylibium sp. Pch-M TaxID=2082386 RepID=UPI001010F126|nr:hypothetical protein [Methylibium sp. Pch-M]QAZ39170.1 hypothetical protein C1M51_06825 [Methylibium sp. Pch-M]